MTSINKLTLSIIAPLVLIASLHAISFDIVGRQEYARKHGPVVLWKPIDPCGGELICLLQGGRS